MERGRERAQFLCEALADERSVTAPRHDVGEEDVPVRHEHFAAGQIEVMEGREIRIVVAGEKGRVGDLSREKFRDQGPALGGVGGPRAGAGVERVAVENQVGGGAEERAELS